MQPDWAEHAVSIVVVAGLIIGGIATVAAGPSRRKSSTTGV